MHSAAESPIGLPSRSTSASRMLAFVTPPDVRRSFTMPPCLEYSGCVCAPGCGHRMAKGWWTGQGYPPDPQDSVANVSQLVTVDKATLLFDAQGIVLPVGVRTEAPLCESRPRDRSRS